MMQGLEMAGYDDHMNLPWDSLREQDWASLGCDPGETDFDVLTHHEIFGNQSSAPIEIERGDGDSSTAALLGFQCSPVAVDSSVDFLWESLGNAKQTAQNSSIPTSNLASNNQQSTNQEEWLEFDQDGNGDLKVHDDNKHILPALPSSPLTYAHFSHGIDGMRDESTAKDGFCTGHFCCVAVGDGRVSPHTSDQARFLLENLKRSAGRDEHAVVRLKNEASMDLKILVFPYASPESLALREYIASNVSQIPAPFVLLCGDLSTGMKSSFTDHVSTKVKSYIIKGLAECMSDKRCNITASKLKGNEGPRAAVNLVEPIASSFFKDVIDVDSLPNKSSMDVEIPSPNLAPKISPRPGMPYVGSSTSRNTTPDDSVPSTPRGEEEFHVEAKATAHFPVNLFVTAIADGSIESDTPQKIRERLAQIVRKVPKEQNTNVEVCDGGTIDLKMRVFVVNSEDAKAVGEYINSHLKQNPAPFVVLARHLPMAVRYDPTLLDLTDASVADRLRKQAKTRAVKVLREAIANKSLGITLAMMRGHEGALIPADRLHDALGTLTNPVHDGENPGKYIVFEARNKAGSVPCSPRKRLASEALDKQPIGSAGTVHPGMPSNPAGTLGPDNRLTNEMMYNPVNRPKTVPHGNRKAPIASASASFLHRDMIVKTFNKRARKEEFAYDGIYDHEYV
eukprot:767028-Hanusia_phi.AAC.3